MYLSLQATTGKESEISLPPFAGKVKKIEQDRATFVDCYKKFCSILHFSCSDKISIGNHMNSSAIWEIIALSHVFEEM